MSSLKEKRMKLTDEEIKGIMSRFNVLPVLETEKAIVFPTCCHNEIGGSHKLYYYKEDKIFKCFTECNAMFDIFDLVQKVDKLRGGRMNLPEAIEFVGFKNDEKTYKENEDLIYLRKLTQSTESLETDEDFDKIQILDAKFMDRFTFNIEGLSPWISEGIGIDALKKFSIRYDITKNAIIIPH